jgi:hypothetical protein
MQARWRKSLAIDDELLVPVFQRRLDDPVIATL